MHHKSMMRSEYLYLETLREFALITMDPRRPNTLKLRLGQSVEAMQTPKRSSEDVEMDDSEPKRLRSEESLLPPECNPPEPKYAPSDSAISDAGTALMDLSRSGPPPPPSSPPSPPVAPTRGCTRCGEEIMEVRKNPILTLCGGDEIEEMKLLSVIEHMFVDRFIYHKIGLFLGIPLLKLDIYLTQNRDNLSASARDMLSDLLEREKAFFDKPDDLLFLIACASEICFLNFKFNTVYSVEYEKEPPTVDKLKADRIISGFTLHHENPVDLALLLIAEEVCQDFVDNFGIPTRMAERMGIMKFSRLACVYGSTDARLLFFRALQCLVDANGLAHTLWSLLEVQRKGSEGGETDITSLLQCVPRLSDVAEEILDEIYDEEQEPSFRPHMLNVLSSMKKKKTGR